MVEEEVWKFPKVGSKKQRVWYTPESVSHPAKMNTLLTRKLITTFTNPGDVVLDPMAGVGTTLVEGMLLGRNVVGVDIEDKFVKLIEGNLKNVEHINEKSRFKLRLGKAQVLCGDSRNLAQLLQDKMDVVLTSPPYGHDSVVHKGRSGETPVAKEKFGYSDFYSSSPKNIGNLKHSEKEKVDAVVTSPPYGLALNDSKCVGHGDSDGSRLIREKGLPSTYSRGKENIGNLPQGSIDTVVTSPPYSGSVSKHAGGNKVRERFEGFMGESQIEARKYSEDEKNIGNLKHGKVDVVVTSPPFASTSIAKEFKSEEDLEKFAREQYVFKHGRSLEATKRFIKKSWQGYPKNAANIANLKQRGEVDAVITSPPFGEANRGSGIAKKGYAGKHGVDPKLHERHDRPLSEDPNQISNLQYGKSVDAVITSPPYGDGKKGDVSPERKAKDFEEHYVPEMGGKSFHTQQRLRGVKSLVSGYSDDPKNIGNLKLGEVDAVLTSPPYADGSKGRTRDPFWDRLAKDPTSNRFGRKSHPHVGEGYSEEKENIGNLPHEGNVSAIITSPPYSEGLGHGRGRSKKLQEEKRLHLHGAGSYSEESEENIGEIRTHGAVDAVITSPPYEGSLEGTSRHTKGGIPSRDPKLGQTGTYADIVITSPPYEGSVNAPNDPNRRAERMRRAGLDPRTIVGGKARCGEIDWKYSPSSENVGNLKGETYLEAMLKVYREMFKVLKPGGLAIIVLKNFVRHFKVIDLIGDTIRLCEHVGFLLERKIKFKLPQESFWRTNYRLQWTKKFGTPFPREMFETVYDYETVLVFRKP